MADKLSDGAQWLHDQVMGAYVVENRRRGLEPHPLAADAMERGCRDTIRIMQIFEIFPEHKLLELREWANNLPQIDGAANG